jgi:tetratricopeptide (TPR) repeat protein
MKGLMSMIGWMAIAMSAATYAKSNPFAADLARADKVKIAQTAELRGDLARIHENFGEAAGFYKSALKAAPNDATLHNKLGIAYLQLHNYGAARKAFNQAIKHDPRFVNAYNNMGAANCLDKKYNPAIRYLKRALELEETNAPAHLNMAEAWAGLGQMDRAMTEYARAIELNADILSGTPDGVQVRVSTPEQRGRVDYLIAMAYARRGNLEGALEYLRRARDEHFSGINKVYEDKLFAPLWTDARLEKIVRR